MSISNSISCMQELVGATIACVLENVFPLGRCDLAHGTKTFVFTDGRAFTFSRNGSYCQESVADVKRALEEEDKKYFRNNLFTPMQFPKTQA